MNNSLIRRITMRQIEKICFVHNEYIETFVFSSFASLFSFLSENYLWMTTWLKGITLDNIGYLNVGPTNQIILQKSWTQAWTSSKYRASKSVSKSGENFLGRGRFMEMKWRPLSFSALSMMLLDTNFSRLGNARPWASSRAYVYAQKPQSPFTQMKC